MLCRCVSRMQNGGNFSIYPINCIDISNFLLMHYVTNHGSNHRYPLSDYLVHQLLPSKILFLHLRFWSPNASSYIISVALGQFCVVPRFYQLSSVSVSRISHLKEYGSIHHFPKFDNLQDFFYYACASQYFEIWDFLCPRYT